MLAGLDLIDWSSLHHAGGHADDIPGHLAALESTDERRRAAALRALATTLWHSGHVYEATAFAVPFLYELLDQASTPGRAEIAALLGEISRGRALHGRMPVQDPEVAERENDWVQRVRQAATAGLGCAIRLLADPDRRLRLAAAHLAACFPEEAWRTRGPLREALAKEQAPEARGALGLALALVGESSPEAFPQGPSGSESLQSIQALAEFLLRGIEARDAALSLVLDISQGAVDRPPGAT